MGRAAPSAPGRLHAGGPVNRGHPCGRGADAPLSSSLLHISSPVDGEGGGNVEQSACIARTTCAALASVASAAAASIARRPAASAARSASATASDSAAPGVITQ